MDEKHRGQVLLLLFVGVLMGALDLAIIGPAFPAIQAEFGLDTRALAWIFNIYLLFQLVGTPLMAKLSDRYGRRPVYILNLLLFGAGSVTLVLAPGFEMLLVGRAIQGFGAGGIFPVAAAVIGDTFPPEKRGRTLGLLGAVFGIAFLVGPILGGILLRFSWHWLFLINIPIVAGLVWQAWRLLPTSGAATRKPFDAAGALTLSLLLAAFAIALTELDSADPVNSLMSLNVGPFLIVALLLLPVFWHFEQRAADPVVRPSLFGSSQVRLAVLIAIGTGTLESGSAFHPKIAVAALGVSYANASLLMLPAMVATTIGSPLMGRLLDKVGSRLVVQFGLVCVALGALMYGLLDIDMTVFIAGGIIGGLGFAALLGAPLRYIILNEASAADRAAAQGILTVFLSVGQLAGAALVGGVAGSRGDGLGGYQLAFLVLGVLMAVLIFVSLRLKSRAAEMVTQDAHANG